MDEAVMSFVRETLGCECPDEVFKRIDYEEASGKHAGLKVLIGGRLLLRLVPIISQGQSPTVEEVLAMLHGIKEERDRRGLNRTRLMLVDDKDGIAVLKALGDKVWERFSLTDCNDGRVHLHVVASGEIPKALRTRLGI